MTYMRVIPRDLFNEAKLLKCLGQLVIEAERLPEGAVIIHHDDGAFRIEQDASSGAIYVANLSITVGGERAYFTTGMNARGAYPMYCDIGDETIAVFNDDGKFTDEFKAAALK